jgi:hypothetical protein
MESHSLLPRWWGRSNSTVAVHEARVEEAGEWLLAMAAHFSAGGSVVKVACLKCESWTWVSHWESSRPCWAAVPQCTWRGPHIHYRVIMLAPILMYPAREVMAYVGMEMKVRRGRQVGCQSSPLISPQSLRGSGIRRCRGPRGAANSLRSGLGRSRRRSEVGWD